MPLWLLEGAHDAKCAEQLPIRVCRNARDDGVVGPFARAQAVGVLGVQQEVVAPVVQREATPLWHNACSVTFLLDVARSGSYVCLRRHMHQQRHCQDYSSRQGGAVPSSQATFGRRGGPLWLCSMNLHPLADATQTYGQVKKVCGAMLRGLFLPVPKPM